MISVVVLTNLKQNLMHVLFFKVIHCLKEQKSKKAQGTVTCHMTLCHNNPSWDFEINSKWLQRF